MKWNMRFNLWKPDAEKVIVKTKLLKVVGLEPNMPRAIHANAFIARLQKRGFKILGSGCYSTVLWKKGDRVIKVNRGHTDAWMDFCLWGSQKGYAGGLTPKVYSYKKIGDFYVAVMEKIDKCAFMINSKEDTYLYPQLLTYATQYGNNKAAELLDTQIPGCKKFIYDLLEWNKGFGLDLHGENIMFRSDGSMVVVDPVSHASRLTMNRLRAGDFGLLLA